MRTDSLNARLAGLAAATLEARGGAVDLASPHDFDAPTYKQDVQDQQSLPRPPEMSRVSLLFLVRQRGLPAPARNVEKGSDQW